MLRFAKSPVELGFSRSGGSIIKARTDVWLATESGWELMASSEFADAAKSAESVRVELKPGQYTCVFQCVAQESVNGVYRFALAVDGKPTIANEGDANTTPAKNDEKIFKDQFVIAVEGKKR
jgi:hypothetical protein